MSSFSDHLPYTSWRGGGQKKAMTEIPDQAAAKLFRLKRNFDFQKEVSKIKRCQY
jgi:hypothetical protein